MSEAIVVKQAYKKFGKPSSPLWKRLTGKNGKNGNNNGNHGQQAASKEIRQAVVALDRVSFTVEEGEIFGVLGPNGSGKSTLIRLIATLLLPDDGMIEVFGHDVVHKSRAVQQLINRVSVEASFFKKLSPMENLIYGARLYGMQGGETRRKVVEILTRLGLEERSIYSPMEEMSRHAAESCHRPGTALPPTSAPAGRADDRLGPTLQARGSAGRA
jgi:ABC-2 type transport system ATP-binding protein